jgi:hypothetical protein
MPDLLDAIAECLSLHAQAINRLGTDQPELDPRVEPDFRDRLIRQRANVSMSLKGSDPEQHRRHVESLNSGLRILLRRLAPPPPKPAPPPMPTWDAQPSVGSWARTWSWRPATPASPSWLGGSTNAAPMIPTSCSELRTKHD